jgi:CheY-like chemotaxis protein
MMELYFEDSTIELTTANTAQKGLQAINDNHFDVVLCDFSMDGMNGLQLCKAAKEQALDTGRPGIKCLLYTGLNQKLDQAELKRCGVDGVVRKPVPCADIQRLVTETLSQTRKEKAET